MCDVRDRIDSILRQHLKEGRKLTYKEMLMAAELGRAYLASKGDRLPKDSPLFGGGNDG